MPAVAPHTVPPSGPPRARLFLLTPTHYRPLLFYLAVLTVSGLEGLLFLGGHLVLLTAQALLLGVLWVRKTRPAYFFGTPPPAHLMPYQTSGAYAPGGRKNRDGTAPGMMATPARPRPSPPTRAPYQGSQARKTGAPSLVASPLTDDMTAFGQAAQAWPEDMGSFTP